MNGEIDISILKRIPELNTKVILEIEPLAPLSMVSELPGSYYKTLKVPDKKMLCGLFENLLGWHIDLVDRKAIAKELSKLREKQAKKESGVEFKDKTKGSTYLPLLMDYFEVNEVQPIFSKVVFYDDLWSKAYRRSDAIVHPKGTFNISYDLIKEKRNLKRNEKNTEQVDDKELEKFFKENIFKYPLYYSTPTSREYISIDGIYRIEVNLDNELYKSLQTKIVESNISYLGNSEGWVNLKLIEL